MTDPQRELAKELVQQIILGEGYVPGAIYNSSFNRLVERGTDLLMEFAKEERLALLREIAAEECPACKDGAELFRDEESGEWAHERLGLPNFLCEAPEIVAERIAQLQPAKKGTGT